MPTLKLFIAGLPKSGKTEFIKTISDLPLVSVEKKIVTTETLVDMDYGRVHLDGNMLYMYAPVTETDFAFLWESLASEMHGAILLVDSTDRSSFSKAAELHEILSSSTQIPCLVVANKTDLANAASPTELQKVMEGGNDAIVMPCIATRRSSVRQVLLRMLALILDQYGLLGIS